MTHRIFFFLICTLPLNLVGQTQPCELRKNKDGIKVYTCKSDTSKFRSLKAEFVITNTTMAKLKAFLFDAPNFVNWQFDVVQSSALEIISDNEMIYRTVVDAPWPVDDREIIVKIITKTYSDDFAEFHINTVASSFSQTDDLIRVPLFRANWSVRRVDDLLYAVYTLDIDPGGYVPPFLVNMAMADGPHQSFRDLKKILEKEGRLDHK